MEPACFSPDTRLCEQWCGGTDRDGAAVVAEHWQRAPRRLRRQVRELTTLEQRLWLHLSDRAWMGTEVFAQVPVYLPEHDYGRILPFYLPRFGLAVEVSDVDFRRMSVDRIMDILARRIPGDDLLREAGGILMMRCPRESVRENPRRTAELVRWEVGLTDDPPADVAPVALPR